MCFNSDCPDDSVDRRDFVLESAAGLLGLAAMGGSAIAQEEKKQPPTRVLDNPAIHHGKVMFKHNGKETFDGYLARPKAEGIYPAVLVIAGNLITEEYIPNTCAALAVAGFVGLAPNVFHPIPPGTPRNNQAYAKFTAEYSELNRLDDIQVGASYLRTQPFVSPGGLGVVGFCRGGREAMLFGARSREIDAVVAYHPAPMQAKELDRLTIPLQVHHGTGDRAVPHKQSQELERMLKERQQWSVEVFLYEKLDHGFLAYTRPYYNADAAHLSWKRTVEFLSKYLKKG